ncbi:MAG: glycosyltransferase family 39 protein [Solidesulfovibrio sp. DCME]|uniref:glycosyltransferase family 39 protein n=1 Tax=Solidesulfovibrio sp. DCME TaxID=3447380 RepID=UPI003D120F11
MNVFRRDPPAPPPPCGDDARPAAAAPSAWGPPCGRNIRPGDLLALCCITAIAAWLRLTDLGLPSMWWDEVLVPMTARLPLATIVERALGQDIHPPLFYFLIKAVMAASQADWALRLPAALAGIAAIPLLYLAGTAILSREAGLFAAVLAAVNPLLLLLSRQVRPYTLVFDLSLVSLWAFASLLRGGTWRAMACLWAANLALALLHFTALLVIGAEGAMLLCLAATTRSRANLWRLVLFSLGAALAAGASLPFLFGALGANVDASGARKTLAAMAAMTSTRLGETFWYLPNLVARLTVTALTVVGAVRLWRQSKETSLLLAGFALLPMAALLAARFTTYFNPWHLTVLLPAALILAGNGLPVLLSAGCPRPLVAGLLCLALAAPYPLFLHERFYAVGSHTGPYKSLAQLLTRTMDPHDCVVFSDQGLANAVNWYAAQTDPDGGRLARPRLEAGDAKVGLFFVAAGGYGHLATDEATFLAHMGEASAVAEVLGTRVYYFDLPRRPVLPLGPLPAKRLVRFYPPEPYVAAQSLENVASLPLWGGGLIATQNDTPGQATFAFANTAPVPQRLTVYLGFSVTAPGNRLSVDYAFDDEPWREGFGLDKPLGEGDASFAVERQTPYRLFRLRFVLVCASRRPMYPGGNLESLRLKDFQVHAEAQALDTAPAAP